jgi:hypothetical protein
MADDRNSAPPSPADDAASGKSPDAAPAALEPAASPAGAISGADASVDAGRPIGRDEIDPELISLPRTRARIGAVLAFSMIVFSCYMLLRLADDLVFSRQGPEPEEMASPAALLAAGELDNRFVRVHAVPDRSFAVRVAASRANEGSRLTPVQGTDDKLWVMIDGSVWTAGIRYDEVYTGRVRELDELPFADPVRRHVKERAPAPRFVTPEAVRTALVAKAGTVSGPAGDAISVSASTPVRVYETARDRVHIEVISTPRLPDAAAWAKVLSEIGLVAPDATATPGRKSESGQSWIFTAPATGDLAAIETALLDAKLVAARALPIETVHDTTWGQLAARDDALVVAGRPIPWEQISWITPVVPRAVPADAWVLVTSEAPGPYWYVLPLAAVLGLSALLFAWALVRALRPHLAASAAASA